MNKINRDFTLLLGALHTKNARLLITLLTVAMFVISAAAPNCPIGIGK